MPQQSPLVIVRLTPAGRGAVATLLVEGPGAAEAVQSHFHAAGGRPLAFYPTDRPVFGHFDFGARPREEVVVRRRDEASVELHCHGGHAAVTALERSLMDEGGRVLSWQAWAAEHHRDPIAAAARVALAEARTERAALVLLDQFHGALRRAVEAIRQGLTGGRQTTRGLSRFSRRENGTVPLPNPASAAEKLDALVALGPLGSHLVEPWRVVLAGPPNVGKSSLVNALMGYQRAIVHFAAGTTRDVVSAITAVEGWPVELSDTAGLRSGAADKQLGDCPDFPAGKMGRSPFQTGTSSFGRPSGGSELERAGAALARQQMAAAELVILVFDLSRPWSAAEAALAESHPDALVVHNKRDLPPAPGPPRPAGLLTSALYGEGIDALVRAIAGRLVPHAPPPGAAVPFTTEQIDRLQSAAEAAARNDPAAAEEILREI